MSLIVRYRCFLEQVRFDPTLDSARIENRFHRSSFDFRSFAIQVETHNPKTSRILSGGLANLVARVIPQAAAVVIVLSVFGSSELSAQEPKQPSFGSEVLPILSDNCFYCHGPDANHRESDLRLDIQSAAHDYAIVPGEPDDSPMVERIGEADPELIMPPPSSEKSLTEKQKNILRRWIESGAKYETHWAFTPIKRPPTNENSSVHPIDQLINKKLTAANLRPMPRAKKTTLIRRASLDLTGIPPTLEEVDAFLADESPEAFGNVIHRLLRSPRYGERMAWDWMDAARYADSNGYQGDQDRTMWPWRDWVVKSFNENLGWDQFTIQQIAGDQLPDATQEQILATAFLRNHMINGEGGRIPEENRIEYGMDMAETVGTVWLGLTFNCCRCHDHKFDSLSQKEYYSLFAFFNQTPVDGKGGNPKTPPVLSFASKEQDEQLTAAKKTLNSHCRDLDAIEAKLFPREEGKRPFDSKAAADLNGELADALRKRSRQRTVKDWGVLIEHYEDSNPVYVASLRKCRNATNLRNEISNSIPVVMVMKDRDARRDTFVLERGLYNKPGEKVTAAIPDILHDMPGSGSEPNRLALANWIVSPENPLTARVTVNRFWEMLFGTGLVKTVDDFGVQGEYPPQRELLDWLAAEFIESDWDVKRLLRMIMTSQAYQRSSITMDQIALERDPENRLFSRGPRFRMPSWMIRDQALAVSGLLNTKQGGPAIKSYQPDGVWAEATFGKKKYKPEEDDELYRRSLYQFWRRIIGPTIFFDNAKRQVCEVKQSRTNTPLHALTTLNDVTYVEAARFLAQRAMMENKDAGPKENLEFAFRCVLSRFPTDAETKSLLKSFEIAKSHYKDNLDEAKKFLANGFSARDDKLPAIDHAAMTAACLNILNLSETLTKE